MYVPTFNFLTGSISTSSTATIIITTTTTIVTTSAAAATTTSATTTVTEPSSIANSCAMIPNSTMCLMAKDETGNDSICCYICRSDLRAR